jgi:hypothetical protein
MKLRYIDKLFYKSPLDRVRLFGKRGGLDLSRLVYVLILSNIKLGKEPKIVSLE